MKGSKTKKGTTTMPKKEKSETVKNSTKEVDVLGENLNAHNDSTSTDDSESISSVSISSENLQPKKDLTPAITLSCFRTWNMEKLEHCFKNYNSKLRKKKTGPQISLPKLSKFEQFQPWWDEFSKLPKESSKKVQVDSSKDADSFNNWFDNSCSQEEDSSWLCGPGSSDALQNKSAQVNAPVEDIEVPNIYDQAPKTKGRRALKRDRKAEREKTLGKKWFEMRAPEVDDNTRLDMEMIRMRGVLDPKRFYKHNDRGGMPKYFQMGTVVDEGTDFYSSRLTKKQRKQTLVEELMADANIRQYNKRKYSEVQQKMRNKKFKGKKTTS